MAKDGESGEFRTDEFAQITADLIQLAEPTILHDSPIRGFAGGCFARRNSTAFSAVAENGFPHVSRDHHQRTIPHGFDENRDQETSQEAAAAEEEAAMPV